MPSARRETSESERDTTAVAVGHELALLLKSLASKELKGDDFHQAFQEIDPRGKGCIASKSDVLDVILDAVAPKHQRRLNLELLIKAFRTKGKEFDYEAFCRALEECQKKQLVHKTAPRSPQKSPQKRIKAATPENTASEGDVTTRTIRVDPRLETQRLLTHSIRRKLVHGVIGAQYDGFQGIQETLFHLDHAGEGFLDPSVFEKQLLRRLKHPLTKQETQFLVANLRVRGQEADGDDDADAGGGCQIQYEQLATLCNLDSDASADDTDSYDGRVMPSALSPWASPSSPSSKAVNDVGGAAFFAAEKILREFFQQPRQDPSSRTTVDETPRSVVTGAEVFLEQAEAIDRGKTGFLDEQAFYNIFNRCGLGINASLVRSILARFSRSSDHQINYMTFLERYGENPQHARERRKLKWLILAVLAQLDGASTDEWLEYLAVRFDKYDARLHHHRPRGDVPAEGAVYASLLTFSSLRHYSESDSYVSVEFVYVLRGSSGPVTLPVEDATALLAQFLCVSRSRSSASAVAYHEFLRIVRDCYVQQQAASHGATNDGAATDSPSSASPCKSPESDKTTPAPPSSFVVTNVADYLIHDATQEERSHFEDLMEALHKFQQRVQRTAATVKKDIGADGGPPVAKETKTVDTAKADVSRHNGSAGLSGSTKDAAVSEAGLITSIENGILMSLGAKLQVRIQFTTEMRT